MAVIQAQGGNNWLDTLGMIAGIGGKFIPGMQWLTPLGMGINAVNSITKGDGAGALASTIAGLKEAGLFSNAAQSGLTQNPLTDTELMQKWRPFLYDSTGGYGTWLR